MTRVRQPRLLDASLGEKARLEPTAMSLTLNLRDTSYARMTLAGGAPEIAMHDWMELFTAKGSAGLFRVTRPGGNAKRERALTLLHAIDTLSDDVWNAQEDFDGYVDTFLAALLGKQKTTRWQLGACADTSVYKRPGINYTRLSDLLSELLEARPDYYLTFDFSTSPWTVNLAALPGDVSAEFRLSRNVETAEVTRDDAEMCTRLYLSVNTAVTGEAQSFATRDFEDYREGYYLDAQAVETAGAGWTIKRHSFSAATTFRLMGLDANIALQTPLALAYQQDGANHPLTDQDIGGEFTASALLINYSTADTASAINSVSIVITDADGDVKTNLEEIRTYNNAAAQAIYGIIEKPADIDTASVPDPDAWAQRFMADRAEPAAQITIDGWELKQLTGDTWDELDRGRKVRAALNDMGEMVTARVESVTYPDVYGQPEKITVELANRLARYSSAIARLQKESKSNGRAARGLSRSSASAKSQEHLELIVQKIEEAQKDTGIAQLWESGFVLDAQAGVRIYSLYQGFESNYAGIQLNNQKIALVVQGTTPGNFAIKAASIMLAINNDQSEINISADKIYLNGQTSISDLLTGVAVVSSLRAQGIVAGTLSAGTTTLGITTIAPNGYIDLRTNGAYLMIDDGDLYVGSTFAASWKQKTIVTGVTVSGGAVTDVQTDTIYYLGR